MRNLANDPAPVQSCTQKTPTSVTARLDDSRDHVSSDPASFPFDHDTGCRSLGEFSDPISDLADRYAKLFELEGVRAYSTGGMRYGLDVEETSGRSVRRWIRSTPRTHRGAPPRALIASCLSRSDELIWFDARGLDRVSMLVIDCDLRALKDGSANRRALLTWAHNRELPSKLPASRRSPEEPSWRALVTWYAGVMVAPNMSALRSAFPDLPIAIETSTSGAHILVRIPSMPWRDAFAIGEAMLAMIDRYDGIEAGGVTCEVFPRPDSGGLGRLCRLPLTGGHRLYDPDLVRHAYARRSIELDLATLERLPVWHRAVDLVPNRVSAAPRQPEPSSSRRGRPSSIQSVAGLELDDDMIRALVSDPERRLKGPAYHAVVVALLRGGIPAGASFESTRLIAATCAYAGLDRAQATKFFERFLERREHRCASPPRELRQHFRDCWRSQSKVRIHTQLSNEEIRAEMAEIYGRKAPSWLAEALRAQTEEQRRERRNELRRIRREKSNKARRAA